VQWFSQFDGAELLAAEYDISKVQLQKIRRRPLLLLHTHLPSSKCCTILLVEPTFETHIDLH
jgi:hypothetical protein